MENEVSRTEINEPKNKKGYKWGIIFPIICFIISLVTCFPAYLSIIPFIGIAFAIIDIIMASISIAFGIVGLFLSRVKWPAIAGISLSTLLLVWGIVRYCTLFIESSIHPS